MADDHKTSADIQREIDAHRHRMENRIDEIQARLSPGQLVDELLSYSKGGGQQFVANLGDTVSRNPLPVALLGVSLAWLMAGPGMGTRSPAAMQGGWQSRPGSAGIGSAAHSGYGDYHDLPYATVSGPLQRLGQVADGAGKRYSEFVDDAGHKFRALTDEAGHRAGHFMDETGKSFRGFIDAAGNRIEQFQDETGNLLDEAAGWASHTFRMVGDAIGDGADTLGRQAQHLGDRAGQMAAQAGSDLQHQTDRMMREAGKLLHQQPLIGGALAFALGAALGAVLPRTAQEDRLVGQAADQVKSSLGHEAGKLYEEGKEQAAQVYEDVRDKAGELYAEAKESIVGLADRAERPDGSNPA